MGKFEHRQPASKKIFESRQSSEFQLIASHCPRLSMLMKNESRNFLSKETFFFTTPHPHPSHSNFHICISFSSVMTYILKFKQFYMSRLVNDTSNFNGFYSSTQISKFMLENSNLQKKKIRIHKRVPFRECQKSLKYDEHIQIKQSLLFMRSRQPLFHVKF